MQMSWTPRQLAVYRRAKAKARRLQPLPAHASHLQSSRARQCDICIAAYRAALAAYRRVSTAVWRSPSTAPLLCIHTQVLAVAIQFDPSFSMGSRSQFPWQGMFESSNSVPAMMTQDYSPILPPVSESSVSPQSLPKMLPP
ncbi:uncharacterized protein TrAtP1_007901 [Trichoderma atroviride]|uniref:uncharacterized protein n=1 Tax=Hypocrea atroviridis TaxID=63577 RepID=UPI003332C9C5|nr:hypothetical protein TrAtP1_007901 [Trichoderma atroviride]